MLLIVGMPEVAIGFPNPYQKKSVKTTGSRIKGDIKMISKVFNVKKSIAMVAAAFALLSAGCEKPSPEPFRVGTNTWPGYEPLHLAQDLGYYKTTGIEVIRYTSATEVSRAFSNGFIDAAALTMDEVLLLKEHMNKPSLVLVMDFSNGGDVIIVRRGIKNMKDLVGKRVGAESNALGAFFLSRALSLSNMSINDVQVVPLEIDEHEVAFKSGIVDAVVTFEPVRSNLLKSGARIVFDSSKIPGEIVDVLIVREEVAENRGNSMELLLSGWFRAVEYIKDKPADAARVLAKKEGVTEEQFLESLKGLHIPDRDENIALLSGRDESLKKGVALLSVNMAKSGLLDRAVDATALIDKGPVTRVK